jgi:hypothetical protein
VIHTFQSDAGSQEVVVPLPPGNWSLKGEFTDHSTGAAVAEGALTVPSLPDFAAAVVHLERA